MARRERPPWCGECHQATRLTGDPPKRCPACHPLSVRNSAPDGEPRITDGLVRLSAVTERKLRWEWQGRIPRGHLTIVDGDPGVGKSTVVLDWGARLTAGTVWPDGQKVARPRNVLLMTAEEGIADTVLPRFRLAGGDPDRLLVLSHIPTTEGPRLVSLPADLPYIEQIITQENIGLVDIDVLNSYFGAEVDTHTDAKVRRALYHLFSLAQRTQCSVVALRHFNKQADNKNALYRGGGSIGITGQARAVYAAFTDPADPSRRLLCNVKNNNAKLARTLTYSFADDPGSGCASVVWAGEDNRTAAELLDVPKDLEEQEERDHVGQWVQDYLFAAGGEAPFGDLLTAARERGIAKATLQRSRRRAGVSYKRSGWQAGSVWALQPDVMADLTAHSPHPHHSQDGEADEANGPQNHSEPSQQTQYADIADIAAARERKEAR